LRLVAVNRWGDALVDEEATIEVDHLPRDIARLLGAQIRDERRHIAGCSHSADRDLTREVSLSRDHLGIDERGRNGMGRYPERRILAGDRLGEGSPALPPRPVWPSK